MSDLVFNHHSHEALADIIVSCLSPEPGAACHVLFSHHIPSRREQDLAFFDICAARGLGVEEKPRVFTDRMFPEDDSMFAKYPLEWRQYVYWRVVTLSARQGG